MDEIQPEKQVIESDTQLLCISNLIITTIAIILISLWALALYIFCTGSSHNPGCGGNEGMHQFIINLLIIIFLIISIIFSIEGLIRKKLSKFKTIYIVFGILSLVYFGIIALHIFN
jgi:hypothetical protein